MGPLTQLFAHQLKQLRKFIDVHDQITYPFPLKAGKNSSSETQRGAEAGWGAKESLNGRENGANTFLCRIFSTHLDFPSPPSP